MIVTRGFTRSDVTQMRTGVIKGTAALFWVWSQPIRDPDNKRRFRERLAPTAFDRALRGADVLALWQHNEAAPLARVKNGSLRLWTDTDGLRFEMTPIAGVTWAKDTVACVGAGLVDAMSFGFRKGDGEDRYNARDNIWERTLYYVDLLEISLVTWPAYPGTFAAYRFYDPAAERRRQMAGFNQHMLNLKLRQTQLMIDVYEANRR